MGKEFGALGPVVRGILYYRLAPNELRPMANALTRGIPNFVPRTTSTFLRWLPIFTATVMIYYGVDEYHYKLSRKNIKDYADEKPPPPTPPPEPNPVRKSCD